MARIQAVDVTKDFGSNRAVDHVSLAVESGEVVGLLGANGAGKTTLIRLLLGLVRPTQGTVELLDGPPDMATRHALGYMPQGLGLYDDLSVVENLQFQSAVYGDAMPVRADLADVADVLVGSLPLGLRRQTAFAAALGHHPQALVLDEPTSGVGPLGRAALWDTIHDAADDDVAVLVTTHYMDEAEQCDRLVILARGQQVAAGTPTEIIGDLTIVEVGTRDPAARRRLEAAGYTVVPSSGHLRVIADDPDAVIRALGATVADDGVRGPTSAPRVAQQPATLEETFMVAVGSGRIPA